MAHNMTGKLISNCQLNQRYGLMGIQAAQIAKEAVPGQFVNVKILTNSNDPLLRRPFSIHKVDRVRGIIYILFKIIGKGTEILFDLKKGTEIELLGPLGNGFEMMNNKSTLLIGGGIGIAPLYQLAAELTEANNQLKVLLGLTDKEDLILSETMEEFDSERILVEEIPGERQGFVTRLLQELDLSKYDQIYVCGPRPMFKAVKDILGDRAEDAQFSMEEKMGCGVGLCFSCTCKVEEKEDKDEWHNKRVCVEGPIFRGDEVVFDD